VKFLGLQHMSKQEIKKLVPKLRFPEFQDTEKWEEMQLSKLGQTLSGLSGKSGADFGSGKPYVTYKQVFDCTWIDFTKCERVMVADNEKQNQLQYGDILFTASSETPDEVGFASVLLDAPSEPIYLNSFCFSFRPDSLEMLRPGFSRYLFHSAIYRKLINILAQGTTRFNISKGAFLNLKLPISTNPNEQQKIADCLSSIDELISLQNQKVNLLTTYKRSLMQQLFPAEGKTVPKLRFPEFRNTSEWEIKTIGSVLIEELRPVKMLDKKDYSLVTVKRRYGGVVSRGVFKGKSIKVKSQFVLKKNDFLISKRQIVHCACGLVPEYLDGSIVSNEYSVLVARENNNILFFNYFSQQPRVSQSFLECSIGIVIEKMLFKLNDWLKKEFLFPSYAEQQKIANALSDIESLIDMQIQKLEILKAHKKGLLQQLFPIPDEINQ
jgi:type I restriction enzyme S subunit